jgi:hypothetical protein
MTGGMTASMPGPALGLRRESALARWAQYLLLPVLIGLWVPHATSAIGWLNREGLFPVKPRDYTLAMSALAIFCLVLSRPVLVPGMLVLLVCPFVELLEATFIRRFEVLDLGDHNMFLLNIASGQLVTTIGLISLASRNGKAIAVAMSHCTIFVCVASLIAEVAGIRNFTNVPGRPSGFPGDPNNTCILMNLMLSVLFMLEPRFWRNIAVACVVAVAATLTLSRSGMMVFALLCGAYVVVNARKHFTGLFLAAFAVVPAAVVALSLFASIVGGNGVVKDKNATDRFEAIFSMDFEKMKSSEREGVLKDGIEAINNAPMFGYGTGSGTTFWMPHNQIVSIWLDLGIIGPVIFLGSLFFVLAFVLGAGGRGCWSLIPAFGFIPFSQILLFNPAYWYALAVTLLITARTKFVFQLTRPRNAMKPSLN